MLNINDIAFGNPCLRDYQIMQTENYLDRLIPDLQKFPPPANDSDATRGEINGLIALLKTPRNVDNNYYDEQLLPHIRNLFVNAGAEADDIDATMKSIADDVLPLVIKLKFLFQRPRPSTLAYYHKLHLFPDFSYFTNSPSYPSCHTTLTAVTCEVLGNQYPEAYDRMKRLTATVLDSRLYLGVHYSSDNDMAMLVAQRVVDSAEFKLKHKL